jgi:ubiquitin-conjugating enzyme E2 D/E
VPIIGAKRRIMRELEKLELLESENKFIIDANPFAFFGNKKVPPRFNNTTITPQPSSRENLITLQGRILPQSEPFCRASFLIEITLSNEYPFKIPSVTLLDPIYHPNACESDRHYRICGLNYDKIYHPKMSLTEIIEDILRIIDRDLDIAPLLNPECYREYKNDYPIFYKKALEYTLSYGRPRF